IKIINFDENEIIVDDSEDYQAAKTLDTNSLKCIAWNDIGKIAYDACVELEDGICVKFIGDQDKFKTGDYWLIPARTILNDILWPPYQSEQSPSDPCALPPVGIKHHYSLLAVINNTGSGWEIEKDLRSFFSDLSSFPRILYAGGDGQTGIPGKELTLPLKVRVVKPSDAEAKVSFAVVRGNGSVNQSDFIVTDSNVECIWTLGDNEIYQQATATLLDELDQPVPNSTIHFNAYLSYPYIYYVGGDGQSGEIGTTLNVPLKVGVFTGKTDPVNFSVLFTPDGRNATRESIVNGYASYEWTLANTPIIQFVTAQLYDDENDEPFGNIIRFHATIKEEIIPIAVNSGKITLKKENNRLIYGPFIHSLKDITEPPAIILGLEKDYTLGKRWQKPGNQRRALPYGLTLEILRVFQNIYSSLSNQDKTNLRKGELGNKIDTLFEWLGLNRTDDLTEAKRRELITVLEVFQETEIKKLKAAYNRERVIDRVLFMEDYELSLKMAYPCFKAVHITLTDFRIELDSSLESNKLNTINIRWWAIPGNEQGIQRSDDISAELISGINVGEEIMFELSSKYEIHGSHMHLTYAPYSDPSEVEGEYNSRTIIMEYDETLRKFINKTQTYDENIYSVAGKWRWQWRDKINETILMGSFEPINIIEIGMLASDEITFSMMEVVSDIAQEKINEYCALENHGYNFVFHVDLAGSASTALEKVQGYKAMNINALVTSFRDTNTDALSYIRENGITAIDAFNINPLLAIPRDGFYRMHPQNKYQGRVLAENLIRWGIERIAVILQDLPEKNEIYRVFLTRYEGKGGSVASLLEFSGVEGTDYSNLAEALEEHVGRVFFEMGINTGVLLLTTHDIMNFILNLEEYSSYLMDVIWFATEEFADNPTLFENIGSIIEKIRLISPAPAINVWNQLYMDFIEVYPDQTVEMPLHEACLVYDSCWVIAKSVIAAGGISEGMADEVILATSGQHEGTTGLCLLDVNGDREITDYDVWGYNIQEGDIVSQKLGYYTYDTDTTIRPTVGPIVIDTIGTTSYLEAREHNIEVLRTNPSHEFVIEEDSHVTVYFENIAASTNTREPDTIEFRVKRKGENTRGTIAIAEETGENTGIFKAEIVMSSLGRLTIGDKKTRLLTGDPILELSHIRQDGETLTCTLVMKRGEG
ncbi:MAG: hypothetical protein JSV09_13700, partial [Thermoplasmata archaeon]